MPDANIIKIRAKENNMNDFQGFLHSHPKMESNLGLESDHYIVDKKDWIIARRRFGLLSGTDKQQLKQAIMGICETVDPNECDVAILRAAVNKIYAVCSRT